jgi:hypothetical protein
VTLNYVNKIYTNEAMLELEFFGQLGIKLLVVKVTLISNVKRGTSTHTHAEPKTTSHSHAQTQKQCI